MDKIKVSVIVPVFNAEKFLGACLESILNQTLQDFEVIAVDDCSTDNSIVVAENFLERFGGRLKIISLPKNSGSGAVPRNEGLKFSRGEYIFFMDDDDLLMPDALKTLYDAAEKFSADVVHTEQGFTCDEDNPKNLTHVWLVQPSCVYNKIFTESDDLAERMKIYLRGGYCVFPWAKFSRRDFLLANEIKFPHVKICEDTLWTIQIICLAKNFLFVPPPLYVQRLNAGSVTRAKKSPEQDLTFRAKTLLRGADCLEEFMSRFEFFRRNPNLRLRVIIFFLNVQLEEMQSSLKTLTPAEVYEIFLREFSKAGSSQPALISYLFLRPFVEMS